MDLKSVRQAVGNHVGSKVRIRSNHGRHRIEISEGVIADIYPSIFTVRLTDCEEDNPKTLSISYADILTKEVQLMLAN